MYINDIEINFVKENCPSVDIQRISIFLLMYADDMVLISRIEENWVLSILTLRRQYLQ